MLEFIVNPMARRGKGIAEVEKAVRYFDSLGVEYRLNYTHYVKHATEIAYELTLNGADTVVSCGGDGTIHEIINGIIAAKLKLEENGEPYVTKLALLPCGTGNDFMRSANMSIDTIQAADTILNGRAAPADAIEINGIYEICFACRGIDVDVVNMVNASKRKTQLSYLKKILLCLFKGLNYDFDIIIDGRHFKEKAVVAAVLNGSKLATGMNFCPPAKIDDGLLDVIIVRYRPRLKLLAHFPRLKGNNFIDGETVLHYRAKTASFTTDQKLIDIDGELFENKKFDAEIAPNVLNLIR